MFKIYGYFFSIVYVLEHRKYLQLPSLESSFNTLHIVFIQKIIFRLNFFHYPIKPLRREKNNSGH